MGERSTYSLNNTTNVHATNLTSETTSSTAIIKTQETEKEKDIGKQIIITVAILFVVLCVIGFIFGLIMERRKRIKKLQLLRIIEKEESERKRRHRMKKKRKKAKKKLQASQERMKKRDKQLKQILQDYLAGQTETYATNFEDNETNVEIPSGSTISAQKSGSVSQSLKNSKTPTLRVAAVDSSIPDAHLNEVPPPETGVTPAVKAKETPFVEVKETPVMEVRESPYMEARETSIPERKGAEMNMVAGQLPDDEIYEQVDVTDVVDAERNVGK